MCKTLYSGFRFSHHNLGSGYDGIVNDQQNYVCGNRLLLGTCHETSKWRKLNFLLVDIVTLLRGMRYPTIHYFYPENTALLSPLILKLAGKKIVYTIHLKDDYWLSPHCTPFGWVKRQCLKCADVVITLSSEQARNFQRSFPQKRIFFVPHGLDMDVPVPDDEVLKNRFARLQVVVVGNNYRDFDLLDSILRTRSSRLATFQLVGLDVENRARFHGVPGVVCHNRLDHAGYDSLLASSFMMLLPLTFATANNALLEAHKQYLPSACSDIPGIRDYATSVTSLFSAPEQFWCAFDRLAALDLQGYRDFCIRSRTEGRERFSWEHIRRQILNAY
jgi:glycosyltransferase involved in cell wall biosynthesis